MVEFNCFVVFSFPETWNIIRALYYVKRGIKITRTDEHFYHLSHPLDEKLHNWRQAGYRVTEFPVRKGETIIVVQAQPAETRAVKVLVALIEEIGWQMTQQIQAIQDGFMPPVIAPEPLSQIPPTSETDKDAQIQQQQSQIENLERKIDRLTAMVERLTEQSNEGNFQPKQPSHFSRVLPDAENHDDLLDALEIKELERGDDRSVQNFLNSLYDIQNMFRSQRPAEPRPRRGRYEEHDIEIRVVEDEETNEDAEPAPPPSIGSPKEMDVPQFDAPDLDDFDEIDF